MEAEATDTEGSAGIVGLAVVQLFFIISPRLPVRI
jgi:hypothetical protein